MKTTDSQTPTLHWELLIRRRNSATQGVPPGNDALTWVANTVTLIWGERDALLVDTFLGDAQTTVLAERFDLEGHQIRVIDTGHTDTDDTTALHIPSLGLLIAGDAVYNETHPFLVESDRAGRQAWLAAIDRLAAINPQAVVVGHGPLDPDCSPRHIDATRRYIRDFDRVDRETATARDLYDRMLALYPNRINPGSLWGSALVAKSAT